MKSADSYFDKHRPRHANIKFSRCETINRGVPIRSLSIRLHRESLHLFDNFQDRVGMGFLYARDG